MLGPVSSASPNSTTVLPGNFTAIDISELASFTGASVEVDLSWLSPNPCPSSIGCGPVPYGSIPSDAYLVLFDCGVRPCSANNNGSAVGETSPMRWLSETVFAATPGHHYELWGFRQHSFDSNWNASIPLTWTLVGPPFGGFLGVGFSALGVVFVVHSVRRLWPLPRAEPRLF